MIDGMRDGLCILDKLKSFVNESKTAECIENELQGYATGIF